EQVLDLAGFLPAHQVKNRGLQLFRQVIDNGRRIVRRNQLDELGDLFRRPAGQQRGARFGTQLAERFHGEPAVALDEDGKRRYAIAVRELTKNLREVGGMLLLEKIEEIGRGANSEQALYRIQDDVAFPLRRHSGTLAQDI